MKILILAPHPFYQERGTPIAVDFLVKVLIDRGDQVELLTYHEGDDRYYEALCIHRIKPFPPCKDIKPGFSIKKLICDVHLLFRFISLICRNKYDVIHAVEESAFMAMLICPFIRTPFIYDMDSSMTTQMVNKFPALGPIRTLLHFIESLPMKSAEAVVPMCDALEEDAIRSGAKRIVVLKDVSLVNDMVTHQDIMNLREILHIDGYIVMYIGNLESYQGIDLMLESFAIVRAQKQKVNLVVIGGADSDIQKYQRMSRSLGIEQYVHFLGKKPVDHIAAYMRQADLLLSPRTHGDNTPMKIYSYLHSGIAVLATDLPTHTQVMNDKIALLAAANKKDFAQAMNAGLNDAAARKHLAKAAYDYIEREHNYQAFKNTVHGLYDSLESAVPN